MGKSSINGPFSMAMLNNQRVASFCFGLFWVVLGHKSRMIHMILMFFLAFTASRANHRVKHIKTLVSPKWATWCRSTTNRTFAKLGFSRVTPPKKKVQ